MSVRTKFLFQVILGVGTAWVLKFLLGVPDLFVPGIKGFFELGWWYVPMAAFIIVSMSNAVNFTDGLDGLAGLIAATAFAGYGMIALNQTPGVPGALSVSRWSAHCSDSCGSTSIRPS